jgi:hypothetical protein
MATPETPKTPPNVDLLSENLFRVVSVILVFVGCLLVAGLVIQTISYYGGLQAAAAVGSVPAGAASRPVDLVDHAAVITYARGLGAAFIKTSALFLGFILIFTGTLYVLRTAEAAFNLQVSGGATQGSLQTASPGLVIVTLGVLLTIVALTTKSEVDYEKITQPADQAATEPLSPSNTPQQGAWAQAPAEPENQNAPVKDGSH